MCGGIIVKAVFNLQFLFEKQARNVACHVLLNFLTKSTETQQSGNFADDSVYIYLK